jgi:competence protein ComEA
MLCNRFVVTLLFAAALALAPGASPAGQRETPKDPKVAAVTPVNLNTAGIAELETLPGIGRRTAERIVEYREKHGGFKKIEELMNVQGIGEKSFLKLKDLITVTPPKVKNVPSGPRG